LSDNGERVFDTYIVDLLKDYRKDPFLKNEGGSKALSKYIRRDHKIIVNHKKVARLCKKHGLLLKKRQKKKSKFKNKPSKNHLVTRENQVWEFDIKYGYIHGERRFFFYLAFIDIFTRDIKGDFIGRYCKAQDMASTLKIALESNGISDDDNLIIRSDNGTQMSSRLLREYVEGLPVDHEFIPLASPNKNAHIESFFSILDNQLQEQYFWSFNEAVKWISSYVDFYRYDRIHGSLGMSPVDFIEAKEVHWLEKFAQAI